MRKSVWGQQLFLAVLMVGIGAAVLAGGVALFASTFSLLGGCSDRVKQEFPSHGSAVAVVYVSSCGATTPFVTSVAVRGNGAPFDAKTDHVFFRVRDDAEIDVRWLDHALDGDGMRLSAGRARDPAGDPVGWLDDRVSRAVMR